jgi:hypothetical protein
LEKITFLKVKNLLSSKKISENSGKFSVENLVENVNNF